MKKILSFLFSACLLMTIQVIAADLVVQQNGPVGTYASITSAINASADGDRIVIFNRPGGITWDENLNVSKALQFVSGDEGVLWALRGNIVISPSATAKLITIVGMDNQLGNITVGAGAPTGARCRIDVVGCRINGSANFGTSNYNINFIGNTLNNGNLTFNFGRALGNTISISSLSNYILGSSNLINVGTDAIPTNDSIQIIGNKMNVSVGTGIGGINMSSTAQFFQIFNNWISTPSIGIYVTGVKNSTLVRNLIVNNSVLINSVSNSSTINIYLDPSNTTNGIVDVINNACDENSSWTITALRRDGSVGDWSYNSVSWDYNNNQMISGFVNNGTNILGTPISFDSDGRTSTGVIDVGHPGSFYTDLNFTRNDCGAYGGSFSLDNFFPVGATINSPRVFMLRLPRAIYQGVPVRVEAEGYDR